MEIRKNDSIVLMASFVSGCVKYGIIMLYVFFSCISHIIKKLGKDDEKRY
jgi:hypothetical protein